MQKSNISKAMYYDAEPHRIHFCRLFDEFTYELEKPAYAFWAFNELVKLGNEVLSECKEKNIYCCAASDGKNGALLIANYKRGNVGLNINMVGFLMCCEFVSEVYLLDEKNNLDLIKTYKFTSDVCQAEINMTENPVVLIKISNKTYGGN